jgi:ribosomal protein S12 methylthiotransferase accessory factor YcaO
LQAAQYPHLVVGAAARSSSEAACAKALDEVVSLRVALQSRPPPSFNERDTEMTAPATLVDHALWHAKGNRDGSFDFLLSSGKAKVQYQSFADRSINEPADMESLDDFAKRLGTEETPILWIDLTAAEFCEYGSVARVVVPDLVPLSPDDRVRWLGTPRLLRRAGLTQASRLAFARQPHPFP